MDARRWMKTVLLAALALTALVPEARADTETVEAARRTAVMAEPGEKSRVVTRVQAGDEMAVLRREGRWIKVRVNGRTGWITRTSVSAEASARTPMRKTRRKPFVEGRSRRRGFSRTALGPEDRVGADAIEPDEEMLGEEARDEADDRESDLAVRSEGKRSSRRFEEEADGEDELGEAPEAAAENLLVVVSDKAALLTKPSSRGEKVMEVEEGHRLYKIRATRSGNWYLVEDDEGEAGWVRATQVAPPDEDRDEDESGDRQPFRRPKLLKRAGAGLGFSSVSMSFRSVGGTGTLANYAISSAAANLGVRGEVIYDWKPRYLITGDLRYTGTRATPGVRVPANVSKTMTAGDIGFTVHQIDIGAGLGYKLGAGGTTVVGRLGYHYERFAIDDVADPNKNVAALPTEILSGVTVGAHLDVPQLKENLGLRIGADLIGLLGDRKQTAGLEDGASSSVGLTTWLGAQLLYQWKPSLTLSGAYQLTLANTSWQGVAEGSARGHNAMSASRKDTTHTLTVGLGKSF